MTRGRQKNVGASVRDRLTQRARAAGENVQLILTRYAIERLLYRLSISSHSDKFVLKGAMLFSLWSPTPYRATGDLDLLGMGDPAATALIAAFRDVLQVDAADDGATFAPDSLRAELTRPQDEYAGVRSFVRRHDRRRASSNPSRCRVRRRCHACPPADRISVASRDADGEVESLSFRNSGRRKARGPGFAKRRQ